VLAWRVKAELARKGGKAGGKGSGKGPSRRQERFRSEQDLRHQVQDSLAGLGQEAGARVESLAARQRVRREFGLPDSLAGLTEDEAVALALMLSQEEADAELVRNGGWDEGVSGEWSEAGDASEDWGEGEWDVDGLDLDDLSLGDALAAAGGTGARSFGNHRRPSRLASAAGTDADDTTTSGTRSPKLATSLSVPQSPYLLASSLSSTSPSRRSPLSPPMGATSLRDWAPVSPSAAAYEPYAYSPGHHHKVQLSPHMGPVYGYAGGGSGLEEVPDLGEEAFPSMTGPASPSPVAAPAEAPPTQTRTPARKGWSEVARSPVATPPTGASPGVVANAWARPTRSPPAGSPWSASPSALTRQLSATGPGSDLGSASPGRHGRPEPHLDEVMRESGLEARRKAEEEELEFVMRLSLAEAESRGEA